jgi:hypothetical protein
VANATAAVQSFTTDYVGGQFLLEQLDVAIVQDYFPRVSVGVDANGYLAYCDDTQDIQFLGLVDNSVTVSVLTGDVQGTRKVTVIRPRYFSIKIAGATINDRGKPVYARYNNEGQYGTGTYVPAEAKKKITAHQIVWVVALSMPALNIVALMMSSTPAVM